jgi:nucleoid DNA-binding protein
LAKRRKPILKALEKMSQGESLSSDAGDFDASNGERRTLTRADLAEAVHRRTGLGRAESAKYVEMVLDEIFTSIISRDDVKLSSFGAFLSAPSASGRAATPRRARRRRSPRGSWSPSSPRMCCATASTASTPAAPTTSDRA